MDAISSKIMYIFVAYIILVGHFAYSNIAQTLGPNIVLTSKTTNPCGVRGEAGADCMLNCPVDSFNTQDEQYSVGFPFATRIPSAGCPGLGDGTPVSGTMVYNWAYLATVTAAAISGSLLLRSKRD